MKEFSVLEAIELLANRFKLERYTFLAVNVLSFLFLLACAGYTFWVSQNTTVALGMFGTSGVIVYTNSQMLKVWTTCIDLISKTIDKNGK